MHGYSAQIVKPLSEQGYIELAEALKKVPEPTLRVAGIYDRQFHDLEFLKHFPFLRKLSVELFSLQNVDGLRHLGKQVESLTLGRTGKRTISLSVLAQLENLTELYIEGHSKDIATISSLKKLRRVTLRSVTLPDLSVLKPLPSLRSLDLKLGGTKNLDQLPELRGLRYLELWMIRGLTDVSSVAALPHLKYLCMQSLRGVEVLPSMRRMDNLRWVCLDTMRGLHDLSGVAAAPNLDTLLAIEMSHLKPEAFECFRGHPALKHGVVGLGSDKKNRAVQAMLKLSRGKPWGAEGPILD